MSRAHIYIVKLWNFHVVFEVVWVLFIPVLAVLVVPNRKKKVMKSFSFDPGEMVY
jgi:hypothetical protein